MQMYKQLFLVFETQLLFVLDSKMPHPELLSIKQEATGKNGSCSSVHQRNIQGNIFVVVQK